MMKAILVVLYIAGAWGRVYHDESTFPTMQECLIALSEVRFQREMSGSDGDGYIAYCKPKGEADRD